MPDLLISEFHALACRFLLIYVTEFAVNSEKKDWINSFNDKWKKESKNESRARCAPDNDRARRTQSKVAHSRGLFLLEMWSG